MIHDHRLCALVPARGGSKGIPKKNLYNLAGVSLVERSVRLARKCPQVDEVLVSTEDPEIRLISIRLQASTPLPRPLNLASDNAKTIDVLADLVESRVLSVDDCLMLLQPTTPLRSTRHLVDACNLLEANWDNADAVVTVCPIDGPHPFKAQTIRNGLLQSLVHGHDSSVPRQSLPTAFLPNGAVYLAKIRSLLDEYTFFPKRSLPLIMPAISSINLDSPMDLLLLEAVVSKGLASDIIAESER